MPEISAFCNGKFQQYRARVETRLAAAEHWSCGASLQGAQALRRREPPVVLCRAWQHPANSVTLPKKGLEEVQDF